MPHWHPTAESVTVLSGEFRVGAGNKFDESALTTLPAHSVAVVPPHHNHYAMSKGETEVQVSSTGPFKLVYVNPADDPTHKQASPAKKGGAAAKKAPATK
jgi:quercetin dioxygenase-like cupin family protein